MTGLQMQTAIREGRPFEIRMANGVRYKVRDRYRIAIRKTVHSSRPKPTMNTTNKRQTFLAKPLVPPLGARPLRTR